MISMKYMIDIETTGVDFKKDELLEVGVVEVQQIAGLYQPTGRTFRFVLHYPGSPQSVFAKKHMSGLYKECNEQPETQNIHKLRTELKNFIHSKVVDGKMEYVESPKIFMGKNISNFDLPFLISKGVLDESYIVQLSEEKEELRGDIHYRYYDMTGAISVFEDALGEDLKLTRNQIMDKMLELDKSISLPEGKEHDALYDCHKQLKEINGMILFLKSGKTILP